MKCWLRWAVSLALGGVAGLLAWLTLPATPLVTVTLPQPTEFDAAQAIHGGWPFTLEAISSDARFLVTFGKHKVQKFQAVHVWDRRAGTHKPFIEVPFDQPDFSVHTVLFSPDEQTLAVTVRYGLKKLQDFVWFDLRTGSKIKGVQLEMDHLYFAADGKLHYVNGDIVRDMQTGEGLRKLEAKIDGFQREDSLGSFAVYRDWAQQVRVYSWLTGKLHTSFTLQREWGFIGLANEGKTAFGLSGGPDGFEIVEASNTRSRLDSPNGYTLRTVSPDGDYVVIQGNMRRPAWLSKIWPVDALGRELLVTNWKTNTELAAFRDSSSLCFSPKANQLAVLRDNLAVEVYDFPLSRPWYQIVGIALVTAAVAWLIGWLWSRWYATRSRAGPASAPPAA